MALPTPTDLLDPFGKCLTTNFNALGFQFPPIGQPGMSPILLGAIGAMLAPAAQVLKFIPPKPDSIKDIQKLLTNLPSVVINGFSSAAKGLPIVSLEVAGITVSMGEIQLPKEQFNSESIIGLIKGLVTAPIEIFKGIIESLIKLQPKFPDKKMIEDILSKALAANTGMPENVSKSFVGCLSNSFMEVITGIIP